MYALAFMYGFISLTSCFAHIICFHGKEIIDTWKAAINEEDKDIHAKMMTVYPEVPQLWYAIFYIIMVGLSMLVVEVYDLQLPWWGLLVATAFGWELSFPICAMQAITGFSPGLNVITELTCGYMLPGKPIANMAFKSYGYMAMYQCQQFLQDLKLSVYMKIPPRAMLVVIINSHRDYLDGTSRDPQDLWTGVNPSIYWGSALIYGALGPKRMFNDGPYSFIYWGFLIGAILPVIQWGLSKKYPQIPWAKYNISILSIGMANYVGG
ncbi:hypothetical protein BGZ76_001259 [Entomortierella beljakovae]|nr:hypothetical protein BGZ76_001259 [Entomortierella beljakovae]